MPTLREMAAHDAEMVLLNLTDFGEELEYAPGGEAEPVRLPGIFTAGPKDGAAREMVGDVATAWVARADLAAPEVNRTLTRYPDGAALAYQIQALIEHDDLWELALLRRGRPRQTGGPA